MLLDAAMTMRSNTNLQRKAMMAKDNLIRLESEGIVSSENGYEELSQEVMEVSLPEPFPPFSRMES